jgi:hypothetical protein
MLLEGRWYFICCAVFSLSIFQFVFQMVEVASSRDVVAYVEHSVAAWRETSLFILKQAVVIASLVGVYVLARHGRGKVVGAVEQVVFATAASLVFLFVVKTALLAELIDAIEAGM